MGKVTLLIAELQLNHQCESSGCTRMNQLRYSKSRLTKAVGTGGSQREAPKEGHPQSPAAKALREDNLGNPLDALDGITSEGTKAAEQRSRRAAFMTAYGSKVIGTEVAGQRSGGSVSSVAARLLWCTVLTAGVTWFGPPRFDSSKHAVGGTNDVTRQARALRDTSR